MTYDEHMKKLNDEAVYRGLGSMTEVENLEIAQETGKYLIKQINETSNLTKKQIKQAKHAIAEIKIHDTRYVAALYQINGADILLRATDPVNRKFYVPNEVWITATNAETEETELILAMSIGGRSDEQQTIR